MKEQLKNIIIEFYKSGVQENVDLADVIMDSFKHIPIRQLQAIDAAITEGKAWNSKHAWRYSSQMNLLSIQNKTYKKSKTSLKYTNK